MQNISPITTGVSSLLWFACVGFFAWSCLTMVQSPLVKPVRLVTGIVVGISVLVSTIYVLTFLTVLTVAVIRQLLA